MVYQTYTLVNIKSCENELGQQPGQYYSVLSGKVTKSQLLFSVSRLKGAGLWCLMSVILATKEAQIRRIVV
jgi:hypothetical protein